MGKVAGLDACILVGVNPAGMHVQGAPACGGSVAHTEGLARLWHPDPWPVFTIVCSAVSREWVEGGSPSPWQPRGVARRGHGRLTLRTRCSRPRAAPAPCTSRSEHSAILPWGVTDAGSGPSCCLSVPRFQGCRAGDNRRVTGVNELVRRTAERRPGV